MNVSGAPGGVCKLQTMVAFSGWPHLIVFQCVSLARFIRPAWHCRVSYLSIPLQMQRLNPLNAIDYK